MNYHKKYIKYKHKYLKLLSRQIGGGYKFGDKVIITKDGKQLNGVIKQCNDDNTCIINIDEDNSFQSVNIADIKPEKLTEQNESNKIKKQRKYNDGNILVFTCFDENNKPTKGEKMGKIVDYRNDKYVINGPKSGSYKISDSEIIRVGTTRELQKYKNKIGSEEEIDIMNHNFKYTDFSKENYEKGTLENRIGNFNSYISDNDCCLIIVLDILDNSNIMEDCLAKYFTNDNTSYLHEMKIVKYISEKAFENKMLESIINDHVIIVKEKQKMSFLNFAYLLKDIQTQIVGHHSDENIEEFTDFINNCLVNKAENKKAGMYGLIYPYIPDNITNNIEDMFNSDNIVKSIFNILYCIYLLNIVLDIMHHNCTLNNFKVINIENCSQTYKIKDKFYEMNSNYFVKIDNFNNSIKIKKNTTTEPIYTIENDKYKELCKSHGSCNKYNQKDVFIIVSSLIPHIFNEENDEINELLYEIILIITNYNYGLISAIIKKNNIMKDTENSLFSTFCRFNAELLIKTGDLEFKDNDCEDTYIKDLDISQVIDRYIEKYNNVLNLKEIS